VTEGHARRWRLLAVLTASYGAGAFGMLGISPLTPSLVEGFGLTRLQVALIVPSIYLGGLFFSLPGGRLADRLGVRRACSGVSGSVRSGSWPPPARRDSSRSSSSCSSPASGGAS
jgi:MFS family permease